MDPFENIVAYILERDGYWVRTNYRVALSKDDKERIGRPTCPNWELDIIAYKADKNVLLMVECKSFFDSTGVTFNALTQENAKSKYKLFIYNNLRQVISDRLRERLIASGSCPENVKVILCLAAGKIVANNLPKIEALFIKEEWKLFSPEWLAEKLKIIADAPHDSNIVALLPKLIVGK